MNLDKSQTPQCDKTTVKSSPFRVLNLYACLGGNRYLWNDCEVTAIELDSELARMYKERFPNDNVIVADAHDYLLKNYMNFDFIWSSPPCPSHSRARNYNLTYDAIYPDMKLYEEIILLETRFQGKYCVENVIPYYEPLIPGTKRGRHLYWTNFNLPMDLNHRKTPVFGNVKNELQLLCEFHKIDVSSYKGKQSKIKIARNLVDYEAGKVIFNTARGIFEIPKTNQIQMFDAVL
jgi:DNA (cytosine-5)-methyltransferase 1